MLVRLHPRELFESNSAYSRQGASPHCSGALVCAGRAVGTAHSFGAAVIRHSGGILASYFVRLGCPTVCISDEAVSVPLGQVPCVPECSGSLDKGATIARQGRCFGLSHVVLRSVTWAPREGKRCFDGRVLSEHAA